MNNPENGHDFFSILQKRDPFLASTYENVKKRSLEGWGNMFGKDHGSFSGFPHFHNVERNANLIVPDELKETFSAGEIFLLLNAIFLHDIGKTVKEVKQPFGLCKQYKNCPDAENKIPRCHLPGESHHVKSKEYIVNQWAEIGLPDKKIAEYCADLAFCHNLAVPPKEKQKVLNDDKCEGIWNEDKNFHTTSVAPYGKIRVPLLAAILRIADETDNSWLRSYPESLFDNHETDNFKAFRRYIGDVEFCHPGRCIIFHFPVVESIQEFRTEEEKIKIESQENKFLECLNNNQSTIERMLSDPSSKNIWGNELSHIGIYFDDVYFESNNHLFKKLNSLYKNETYEPLIDVIGEKKKDRLRNLFDALIELSLGTGGYETFSWDIIEAQVGQSLESVDKWLVEKIADNSNDCIVINDEKVHMRSINDNYKDLRNYVLGSDGGENG